MLTDKQRDELKELGLQNVRFKLAGSPGGRAATLNQFLPSGDVTKGDVEDWLLENSLAETAQQNAILFWARVGGVAGIVAALIAPWPIIKGAWLTAVTPRRFPPHQRCIPATDRDNRQ